MKNKKIILGAIVILLIVIGFLWITAQQGKTDCLDVKSAKGIEKCVGKKILATGTLECNNPVTAKAGIHYLKFGDGTQLRFLEEYPNCEDFDKKVVRVEGELYLCGADPGKPDQCIGIGLVNVESVTAQS